MRPRLHFTAETGWINDPHGLTFHDGQYHLFHQYVPDSMVWAPNCHWGHATSPDLLDWTRRGVALAPGDGDDGIWTGSLVQDGPEARILYTSVAHPDLGLGRVRSATPEDDSWDTWTKGDIVLRPPEDLDLIAYRDPFVISEADGWRMFVGGATRSGDALALTYTSTDLETWAYDGVSLSRSSEEVHPVWMGALWECPQIFEVDDHWVMVSSVWDDDVLHYAGYGIGGSDSYREGRFDPEHWGRLSFGASYYAPSFFRDRDGRPCLIFWMRGVDDPEGGWASCLSVPYLLSVENDRLVARPHPQVDERRTAASDAGGSDGALDLKWTPTLSGDRLTLESETGQTLRISTGDGLVVLERPDDQSWTMPWSGGPVRVILDGPVLELSTSDGILGGDLAPSAGWSLVDGVAEVWALPEAFVRP